MLVFGLSKERPILGHHAKAHILESGGFHVKSGGFTCEIERPFARNCNPMFKNVFVFTHTLHFSGLTLPIMCMGVTLTQKGLSCGQHSPDA